MEELYGIPDPPQEEPEPEVEVEMVQITAVEPTLGRTYSELEKRVNRLRMGYQRFAGDPKYVDQAKHYQQLLAKYNVTMPLEASEKAQDQRSTNRAATSIQRANNGSKPISEPSTFSRGRGRKDKSKS